MPALLALLILLAVPAAAAAKPLDLDRRYADAGRYTAADVTRSAGVVALSDGATLHVTHDRLLRLSSGGRRQALREPVPAGWLAGLAPQPRGALVVGVPREPRDDGTRPLAVWRVDRRGRTLAHHVIELPGGADAGPVDVVGSGGKAFALVRSRQPGPFRMQELVVALTPAGALDTTWGDGGVRVLGREAYEWDQAIGVARDGSVTVAQTRSGCALTPQAPSTLRIVRLRPDGGRRFVRTHRIGPVGKCFGLNRRDIVVDSRGRTLVASSEGIARFRRDGSRDRAFARGRWVRPGSTGRFPVALATWRGGYAVTLQGDTSRVALFNWRGRHLRTRKLHGPATHPLSGVEDLALDRRGGLIAAGSIYYPSVGVREDYGDPRLAVWRLKTR